VTQGLAKAVPLTFDMTLTPIAWSDLLGHGQGLATMPCHQAGSCHENGSQIYAVSEQHCLFQSSVRAALPCTIAAVYDTRPLCVAGTLPLVPWPQAKVIDEKAQLVPVQLGPVVPDQATCIRNSSSAVAQLPATCVSAPVEPSWYQSTQIAISMVLSLTSQQLVQSAALEPLLHHTTADRCWQD
jgi:hypothetical protein